MKMPMKSSERVDEVKRSRPDLVRLLLSARADMERETGHGVTALHMAAYHGHVEVVQVCLARRLPSRYMHGIPSKRRDM